MLSACYVRAAPDSSSGKLVQPAISSVAALVLKPGWDLEEDMEDRLELQQCERLCNSNVDKVNFSNGTFG